MKHNDAIPVVYIVTKLELGGAQKVCLSLFNGLAQQGNNSFLISGNQGPLVSHVAHNPHAILLSSMQREISFKNIYHELRTFWTLIKQLRTLKKSYPGLIVHTHSTKAGIMGRWAAFYAGIKKRIHTVHGFGFHQHQSRIAWSLIFVCEWITSFITSHYVCVSNADIATGKRLLPFFANNHSLIRAAVDWQQFKPAERTTLTSNTHFVFGTVSCFKKQKNLLDLFNAFAAVHTQVPHAKLEVIGDGSLRPELEAWIADHHLQETIILHGWQEQVAPFMLTWHAFVLSSLWEGLPCAVVEARLLQLPVISYDTGGIHEVITSGKNGVLCSPGNWQQLAQAMLSISTNKNLYNKFYLHQDDLTNFNDQVMINQHITLYRQL